MEIEKELIKEVVLQIVEKLRKIYVTAILNALEVPRSNYYRWVKGFNEYSISVEEAIIEFVKATKYRNGHRKIKALLKHKYQHTIESKYGSENYAKASFTVSYETKTEMEITR